MLSYINRVGSSLFCAAVLMAGIADAQVAVRGASGASLQALEGTETLVTVVIRATGAIEPNCRVAEVGPNYFAVLSANGDRNAYLYNAVSEVRVQDGAIAHELFRLDQARGLSEDEQATYDTAMRNAGEIFSRAISNQLVRMKAAAILGIGGDESAIQYLQQRALGNDLLLAVQAYLYLNLIEPVPADPERVRAGLASGDPNVRSLVMIIIGMLKLDGYEDVLMESLNQRLAQASAPAAYALGQLKYEPAVPILLDMVMGLNEAKSEAALGALVNIGGNEIVDGLKQRLPNATGFSRYRLIEALVKLDDPLGVRLMKDEALRAPTLTDRAAMVLAERGDFDAIAMLEERLKERYEPTLNQLTERATIAVVLLKQGDLRYVAVLQELLNSSDLATQIVGLSATAVSGSRNMLPLLSAPMASSNDLIGVMACEAVISCVNPEYREKLITISGG